MDGNEAARMELKLMPIDTVCDTVGVSPATLYRLIAAGRFPAPVKIGVRAARWRSDEVRAHIERLSEARAVSTPRDLKGVPT